MLAFAGWCSEPGQCDELGAWLLRMLLWFWALVLLGSVLLGLAGGAAGWLVARRLGRDRPIAAMCGVGAAAMAVGLPWLVASWSVEGAIWAAGATLVGCGAAPVMAARLGPGRAPVDE